MWQPNEIVVTKEVLDESVARRIIERCPGVPIRVAKTSLPRDIKGASQILSRTASLAENIAAGKHVLVLVPTTNNVVGEFEMADPRMGCPHFPKLVTVSNGCPFQCSWCFLKATYRGIFPFMAVHVRYDKIMKKILRHVSGASTPIMFNMGELQDGLALEHLTGAAQTLIPFFGRLPNAFLFLLTKCDSVEPVLDLPHNGHSIIAWSLNAAEVSRQFEIGAPSFERRLAAARRAQEAGYPIRVRLDPIVLLPGWQRMYADTIGRIFAEIAPQRITLGTLRFEEQFYKNREALVGQEAAGLRLLTEMKQMVPMLPPMEVPTGNRCKDGRPQMKTSVGKYSYPETLRVEIFRFAISEIRKHFAGPVALCKETVDVWRAVGLDPGRCACVCQYGAADLLRRDAGAVPISSKNTGETPVNEGGSNSSAEDNG
jgi:spore photoproduct lyase